MVRIERVTKIFNPGDVNEVTAVKDVSLMVSQREFLAIIGGNGSGKSTLALLLLRLYDPDSGTVRVGGHDVRELSLASLRSRLGVVFEDSFLTSDTVRANIAYGRPDATDEEIREVARIAQAEEFIDGLPDGFASLAQGGTRVNVGCESCHGPSKAHCDDDKVQTPHYAGAKNHCQGCHDRENSPEFSLDTYWPKILHGEEKTDPSSADEPAKEAP